MNKSFNIKLVLVFILILIFSGCNGGSSKKTDKPPGLSSVISWTSLTGNASNTYGKDIAVDMSGIYLTGYTKGPLDGQVKTGVEDLFVIKYDSSGNKQWTRLLGEPLAWVESNGITVNNTGIYITGYTNKDFDGQRKTGTDDAFIIKYDSSGNRQWTRLLGAGGSATHGMAIIADSSAIYVTGWTNGNLNGTMSSRDLFVAKYDLSGNREWVRQLGVQTEVDTEKKGTEGRGIALNGNDIYITGYTGNLDCVNSGTSSPSTGTVHSHIVKYDCFGNRQDTWLLGVSSPDTFANDIIIKNSAIYITGYTTGDLDGLTKAGEYDAFLTQYDLSGNKQWTKLSGASSANTLGYGIAADESGVYIAGQTDGYLDAQTKLGNYDAFMIKYDFWGNKSWTSLVGAVSAYTDSFGIAAGASGVCITGTTTGSINGETFTGSSDAFVFYRSN